MSLSSSEERLRIVAERTTMGVQENAQTSAGDNFWGIDHARAMEAEAVAKGLATAAPGMRRQGSNLRVLISSKPGKMTAADKLHEQWQAKDEARRATADEDRKALEELARQEYMRAFWGAESSNVVISHRWESRPEIPEVLKYKGVEEAHLALTSVLDPLRGQTPASTFHNMNATASAGVRSAFEVRLSKDRFREPGLARPSLEPSLRVSSLLPVLRSSGLAASAETKLTWSYQPGQMPVPVDKLRDLRFVTARGWLFLPTGSLTRRGSGPACARVYAALWRTAVLYLFRSEDTCLAFFNGAGSMNRGCIAVVDVECAVAVREISQAVNGEMVRGIELVSPDCAIIVCPAARAQFAPWMRTLGNAVAARNALLYRASSEKGRTTGDSHLLERVDAITIEALSEKTRSLLRVIAAAKTTMLARSLVAGDQESLARLESAGITVGCEATQDARSSCQLYIVTCEAEGLPKHVRSKPRVTARLR